MEVYKTLDGAVTKYIHDDGSETAIKLVKGCEVYNPLKNKKEKMKDRNKYVVFISSSVGCPVKCKFCYLTVKKYPYENLSFLEIINNLKSAIEHAVTDNPSLKKKYIKLSFMGMGDIIFDINKMNLVVIKTLLWVFENKYAAGLDGIDIATVWPIHSVYKRIEIEKVLFKLNDGLKYFRQNPENQKRSFIRLFYSLHTTETELRNELIPINSKKEIIRDIYHLKQLERFAGIDIIFHYMFMNGINDDWEDVNRLLDFWERNDLQEFELRILRFNECNLSTIKATPEKHLNNILKEINLYVNKLKVQHSAGSEIKSACGQFLMKENFKK